MTAAIPQLLHAARSRCSGKLCNADVKSSTPRPDSFVQHVPIHINKLCPVDIRHNDRRHTVKNVKVAQIRLPSVASGADPGFWQSACR